MITLHEVKGIIQKTAALSSYIIQLNQLLPEVVQLTEKLRHLSEDLTLDQDHMTAKIRSVEVLGELLRKHVYQTAENPGIKQLSRDPG